MIKARKRRAVGTKATDAEEEVSRDQLENIIIFQGLKLELESVRRKNPYFKAEHKRGGENVKEGETLGNEFCLPRCRGVFLGCASEHFDCLAELKEG